MSLRQIIFSDNPLLRKKSRHVQQVGRALQHLIDDMIETMRAANGIGLAAIQVGVPQRIIVVEMPEDLEENESETENEERSRPSELYVIVNPKLARRSREMEEGIEGCLSIPGWIGEVTRHSVVTVKGLNRRGQAVRIKAEGLLARVLQHEIDHCDGVLFIDHIEDPDKIWPVAEGEEEAAEATQKARGGATSSRLLE